MDQTKEEIRDLLNVEAPQMERIRVSIMLVILTIGCIFFWIYSFLAKEDLGNYLNDAQSFLVVPVLLTFLWAFQLFLFYYLGFLLKKGKGINHGFLIFYIALEVTWPNVIVFVLCWLDSSAFAMDTPAFAGTLVIILLSTLHLDRKLSLLTGLVAFLGHLGIIIWMKYYLLPDYPDALNMPLSMYYIRMAGYLAAGAAAGFVANQLRKTLIVSFKHMHQRQNVELLFGQQVSHQVVQELLHKKEVDAMEKMDATIMFFDIRQFTVYSRSHTAEEVIAYQNNIFNPLIEIINSHNGIVNQILGDGFMASFGVPVSDGEHCVNGFRAGIEIVRKISDLVESQKIPETRIGIGLATGGVTTGNIGNEIRKQFSIAGNTVIFSARLEQLNKEYGTQFLISKNVFEKVKAEYSACEMITGVSVKGWTELQEIYKVI